MAKNLLRAALPALLILAGCGRNEREHVGEPIPVPATLYDDTLVWVRVAATAEDNGPDAIDVGCTQTVACVDLHLSLRGPTKLTITGPRGAAVTIGDKRVTLPEGPETATTARGEVTFDWGALPLAALTEPAAEAPTLTLPMKVERKSGGVKDESVTLSLGASGLAEVLRGAAQRPTAFIGDAAEGHRPPIAYEPHSRGFFGKPQLVRDVDVLALWVPTTKRPGPLCGPYKNSSPSALTATTQVESQLQDYDVRAVERRTGKVLAQRSLPAEGAKCPGFVVVKKGEPITIDPYDGPARDLLESLRK